MNMEFKNETDRYDQHFLIDQEIVKRFISEARLVEEDIVVEIGPGKGMLTQLIASKVKKMYVIELDKRLEKFLKEIARQNSNIELIFDNVLDTFIPKCTKIITSLPYSIIEPFINKMLKCDFQELLMITGARYAHAVLENKLTKLSLLTNCYFTTEKILDIIPEAFEPKPRVLSTMIRLIPKTEAEITDQNILIFRYLFKFRSQKLKNALVESLIRVFELKGKKLTQKEAKNLISNLNISADLLDKEFSLISNLELESLHKKLLNLEL